MAKAADQTEKLSQGVAEGYRKTGEGKAAEHARNRLFGRRRSNMQNQEVIVQKIRSQYTENEPAQLDALVALDAKVKKPATVFGYTYGSIGAVVMGTGMSLVMTDIGTLLGMGDTMVAGIVIGIFGLVMAVTTYPIYKKILNSRKKKYAPQILELSERMMEG